MDKKEILRVVSSYVRVFIGVLVTAPTLFETVEQVVCYEGTPLGLKLVLCSRGFLGSVSRQPQFLPSLAPLRKRPP